MERLRVIGEAIARSVRAGHWPGHGPTDDHVTEIAENLSRARQLIERHSRSSGPATADVHGQVMHTLYVAGHATAVALGAYVTELRHRLEVDTRRRQPIVERPTTLEITEAQDMIARFGGFEQLAAAYMFGQPLPSRDPGLRAAAPATRLQAALAAWEIQAHRTLAARPDSADLVRVARVQALISSATSIVTEAAATIGQIDRDLFQRLAPTLEANQVGRRPAEDQVWRSVRRDGRMKTAKSRRTLELPDRCVDALSDHKAEQMRMRQEVDDSWKASEPIVTRLAHDGRFIPLRTTCLDCASSGDDAKSRQVMRSGCHTRGTDSELRCGPLSVIADRLLLGCHSSRWGSTSRGSRRGCSSRARRATSRTAGDRIGWARR
jgi:hypothetical protein